MVDSDNHGILLQQMRETAGYKEWVVLVKRRYLSQVRTLLVGKCDNMEDVNKLRTSCAVMKEMLLLTGISKEELKWMDVS